MKPNFRRLVRSLRKLNENFPGQQRRYLFTMNVLSVGLDSPLSFLISQAKQTPDDRVLEVRGNDSNLKDDPKKLTGVAIYGYNGARGVARGLR